MITSVISCSTRTVGSLPRNALRSIGSPTEMTCLGRGISRTFFLYRSNCCCTPHCASGITGTSGTSVASRAAPVLPAIGHPSGSRVTVPSGCRTMTPSASSAATAALSDWRASVVPRLTGMCPIRRIPQPTTGTSKIDSLARNRGVRAASRTNLETRNGST